MILIGKLDPTTRETSASSNPDLSTSHDDGPTSYGVVYVNEIGRYAMFEKKQPNFPAGTVIVREKLAQANDSEPQSLVVMIKRPQGYNSGARDWEFLALDGKLSKILEREKTSECRNCHAKQEEQDFVFRTYLTNGMRDQLK